MTTAWLLILVPGAGALEEAHSYGVELFGGTGECSGGDLDYTIDQADAVRDVFSGWISSSLWDEAHQYGNQGVDRADFADVSLMSWGDDALDIYGAEDADVVYISTHGNSNCNGGQGSSYSTFTMGQDHTGQDCTIDTDTNTGTPVHQDLLIGNTDTKIMLVDACESVQKCVWDNDGYDQIDGSHLRMYGGFHGKSFDRLPQVTAVEDYASNSRLSGAGDNWLDFRWVNSIFANEDHCPTAIVWGETSTVRDSFYNNGGLDDWIDTGANTGQTFYYISGCDPDYGDPL